MNINGTHFSSDVFDILTDLKSDLALHQIDYLRQIKNGPANVQCTCPFHANGKEHKPSFGVSKDTGIGHCFACGTVVDLPELISFCFGRNDMGAYGWQWLRKRYLSIDLENLNFQEEKEDEAPQYVSEEELDSYRYYHPYWKKRGITDEHIIELFDIGYDPKTYSITFPVRDIQGNCLFVARRSVRTKYFNYPSGVTKPLYGLYELYQERYSKSGGILDVNDVLDTVSNNTFTCKKSSNEIFICESMIDCLLLWQSGHYAVALNGLGNKLQMQQLQDLPCKVLILATDNDKAGQDARVKIKKQIRGKMIKDVYFPKDVKDIGECYENELERIEDWVSYGPQKIL